MTIRLKINRHDDKHILLEALSGIDHFGFGTFLCNLQPEEVECDQFSKDALIDASYQDGVQGLEIWDDNRLAWGDLAHEIIMPLTAISNQDAEWLNRISIKENT